MVYNTRWRGVYDPMQGQPWADRGRFMWKPTLTAHSPILPVPVKGWGMTSLNGAATPAGVVTKQPRRVVTGAVTMSGTVAKVPGRRLTGVVSTLKGVLANVRNRLGPSYFGIFKSHGLRTAELQSFVPPLYDNSRVYQAILKAQGYELDLMLAALVETLDQFYAARSTWALDTWEHELGIIPVQGASESQRRSAILALLRSSETATNRRIKAVAESFVNGEITIIEDPATYSIIVRFTYEVGIPENLEAIKTAIRNVVPAHLDISYEFSYATFADLDANSWTWDDVDALDDTWNEFERDI